MGGQMIDIHTVHFEGEGTLNKRNSQTENEDVCINIVRKAKNRRRNKATKKTFNKKQKMREVISQH
jgi:hypothetical protein